MISIQNNLILIHSPRIISENLQRKSYLNEQEVPSEYFYQLLNQGMNLISNSTVGCPGPVH